MTPLEFEQRYHQLRIMYSDQSGLVRSQSANVHIYNQSSRSATFREKDRILSALNQELRQTHGVRKLDVHSSHRAMLARAFYGKGSPEDCAIALRLALRYGYTQPTSLQHYCDQVARIGLDCSGFINSYFRSTGVISRDRNIAQYAQGTPRNQISDTQPRDVLIWANERGDIRGRPHAHIAILNDKVDARGKAVVVESASSLHGLTHSTYVFTQQDENLFRVQRPSGSSYVRVMGVR